MADRAEERLRLERIKKAAALREQGINPYPYRYEQTHHAADILQAHDGLAPDTTTDENVSIAGRVVLLRKMGKATFGHLQDASGRIQFYAREDELGEAYRVIRKLDLGDWLGVSGVVFTTKSGEITVRARSTELLCKAIRPLPDKYHGLKDVEARYRRRHLDLIANPRVRDTFLARTTIIKALRAYLDERGFIEVETPTLQPVYGGANARPFITHHNALKQDLYLRISDELYLKRLLVGGFERVYELCKDFRNEGVDTSHNPEFTMLEWYMAYGDYETGMRMFEEIVAAAATAVHGTTKLHYQGRELDLTPPWRRARMVDLIKEHAGIDVLKKNDEALRRFCDDNNIPYEQNDSWGLLVSHIFEERCEQELFQPVFVIDHPIETTPLCKPLRNGDERFVERFEPFIAGMEVGNAYSELNDPILQRKLLTEQHARRAAGDEEAHPMDEDFLEAIEHGMPPTSGVGLGVDRIVMLLTDSPSIRDVILFPALRPEE